MIQTLGLGLTFCGGSGGGTGPFDPRIATLLSTALIPTRDGVLTTVSSATVDPITGAAVLANTPNGRTLTIGSFSFPGAALLAQRATTGLYGAASNTSNLASNTAAMGALHTERTIVENGAGGNHQSGSSAVALTDGVNYAVSSYVRRGVGARNVSLYLASGGNAVEVIFNLDTGAVTPATTGTTAFVRASARLNSTGEWICQMTVNASAWGGSVVFFQRLVQGTTLAYTGDGTSSLIISGYQVEQGEYATTPLNWDGGTMPRAAASYSWAQSLSLTAGTVVAVGMPYGWNTGQNTAIGRVYDAAGTGILFCNAGANGYTAQRTDSLVAINSAPTGAVSSVAGQQKVITQRFDATSNRITVDGVTVSSAAPTLPFAAATPLIIGNRAALDRFFDGWVSIILFNTALSDSDVALLTSYSSIV